MSAEIVSWVAAFIATAACIVSWSQAISARRQADNSDTSAKLAADQVKIARAAATSAEDQATSARRAAGAAEAAARLEQLHVLQAARRAAADVAAAAELALGEGLSLRGKKPLAEGALTRMMLSLRDLEHSPFEQPAQFLTAVEQAKATASELEHIIRACEYRLWDGKEREKADAIGHSNALSKRLSEAEAVLDRLIASGS